MKLRVLVVLVLLIPTLQSYAFAQDSSRTYRGSIGDKHIEMKLTTAGSKVSGTYFYDQFKQDLKLEGNLTNGQLELTEIGPGKKKTGKFVCKGQPNVFEECEWSRPDGTGKAYVVLEEQFVLFRSELKIVPKFSNDRKAGVTVSYPQLVGPATNPSIASFNELITSQVQKAIKQFSEEAFERRAYELTYNVMLGSDEVVSIEMNEYSDGGGAHPNSRLWTLNYDLKGNKQLKLDDVVQADDGFKKAVSDFVVKDINRRAEEMEVAEAKRENRKPEKRDDPVMAEDGLPEIEAWSLSPKGMGIYFDFPHVIAVFDKTVVPYSTIRNYVKPDGVAAQFGK